MNFVCVLFCFHIFLITSPLVRMWANLRTCECGLMRMLAKIIYLL